MSEEICPACRKPLHPTSHREMRDNSGRVFRRIPLTWDCDKHCQHVLPAAQWNEAVSRLEQEKRDASGNA